MTTDQRFAELPAGATIWAIGAVHGDVDRLRALHGKLADRIAPADHLVYLGNLMGRGAAVVAAIDEVLLFRRALIARPGAEHQRIVFLRGSQEEMWHKLLQIQFAPNPREVLQWMFANGVAETLRAYGGEPQQALQAAAGGATFLSQWTSRLRDTIRRRDGHNALMSALRRAAYSDDKAVLLVNAGIDADRPLSEQKDAFWWGVPGFDRMAAPVVGYRRVVRGFDPQHQGLLVNDVTATLDGGCGFGGGLVAGCFDAAGGLVETVEA